MKKLFVLTIKVYPILQLISLILCNFIYTTYGHNDVCYILDYVFGINMVSTIALLICSYIFHFCAWHKSIIYSNFVCTFILKILDLAHINIDVYNKFIILFLMCLIGLFISLIINFKLKKKIKWLQNHC